MLIQFLLSLLTLVWDLKEENSNQKSLELKKIVNPKYSLYIAIAIYNTHSHNI